MAVLRLCFQYFDNTLKPDALTDDQTEAFCIENM